jgi:hypothetical protein
MSLGLDGIAHTRAVWKGRGLAAVQGYYAEDA